MKKQLSRRAFIGSMALSPLVLKAAQAKGIPIGLELYSVRKELAQDLMGTVRAVAQLGYDGVEFYSPYFEWTTAQAKDVRKLLDDLGIRCFSTHNSARSFDPENIEKAMELNQIIGSKLIVMASAGKVEGLDGWKKVAQKLNEGASKMKAAGMRAGYHNHAAEFRAVEGAVPMNILAKETERDVVLQLDVGTCLEAGKDPVKWIESNPGRFASIHCKEWSSEPGKGYKVLIGEGAADWEKIFEVAEKAGGVEYYLVEQEGSEYPPIETAKRCLETMRKLRS